MYTRKITAPFLLSRLFQWLFVLISLLITVGPLLYTVLSAFKTRAEFYAIPPLFFPTRLSADNYRDVLKVIPIFRGYYNSFLVAAAITVANLFLSSLSGFAFSKLRFPGKNAIFLFVLSTMMIPFFINMIPLYVFMKILRVLNSHVGLILPFLVSPISIFLIRQFMISIPNDLIDSAKIDGYHEFQIYAAIMLPLSRPVLAVTAILSFMAAWDNFLWPLLVIQDEKKATLPFLLQLLAMKQNQNWHLVMTGIVIAAIPMLIFFLLLQKYIVKGYVMSGIKF